MRGKLFIHVRDCFVAERPARLGEFTLAGGQSQTEMEWTLEVMAEIVRSLKEVFLILTQHE